MSILLLLAFAIVILLIVAVIGFVAIRLRRDRLASKERMLNKVCETRLEEHSRNLELQYDCLEAVREGHPEAIKLAPQATNTKVSCDAKITEETPGISLELRGK